MPFRGFLIGVIILSCSAASGKDSDAPHFAFYKMKTGEGMVSLVVAPNTTDRQLGKRMNAA